MLGRATVSAVRVPVDHMTEIDPSVVQLQGAPDGLVNAWRSNTHIAMLFVEPDGRLRLAVSRTAMTAGGHERQHDEMTRTELLRVKRECGFGDRDASEEFPSDEKPTQPTHMRHLWLHAAAPAGGRRNRP